MMTSDREEKAGPDIGAAGAGPVGAKTPATERAGEAAGSSGAAKVRKAPEINLFVADPSRLTVTRKPRGPEAAGDPVAGSTDRPSARRAHPPSCGEPVGGAPRPPAGPGDPLFLTVPTDQLLAFRSRSRKPYPEAAVRALAAAMRRDGWHQPILVRPHPAVARHYEVLVGDLAYQAARAAGLACLPVAVSGLSDRRALECVLLEDVRRPDLTPFEAAVCYGTLIARSSYSLARLARLTGRSERQVARLLQGLLRSPAASDGPAPADDTAADGIRPPEPPSPKTDVAALERHLSSRLGAPVEISRHGRTGAISIGFETAEQLETIARRLSSLGALTGARPDSGPGPERASAGLAA
jgi:ParB/RepB/Spo0J family partition protein